jgi:hypothetical protein
MNIYLLTRTDKHGYDDYNAFVVAADSAYEAKHMNLVDGSSTWTTSDHIHATLVGRAATAIEKGVILGDFNAA